MVSVKGMIIRCSSVIPEVKEATFRCLVCGHYSEPILVDRGIYIWRATGILKFYCCLISIISHNHTISSRHWRLVDVCNVF